MDVKENLSDLALGNWGSPYYIWHKSTQKHWLISTQIIWNTRLLGAFKKHLILTETGSGYMTRWNIIYSRGNSKHWNK